MDENELGKKLMSFVATVIMSVIGGWLCSVALVTIVKEMGFNANAGLITNIFVVVWLHNLNEGPTVKALKFILSAHGSVIILFFNLSLTLLAYFKFDTLSFLLIQTSVFFMLISLLFKFVVNKFFSGKEELLNLNPETNMSILKLNRKSKGK